MSHPNRPDRNLALELVRVTEAAAMAAARWVGRGDKNDADQAAVNAMRYMIGSVGMRGTVVIGEGEKDNAPMLFNGEEVGDGTGPECDVAVDPVDGTTLTAKGMNNAVAHGRTRAPVRARPSTPPPPRPAAPARRPGRRRRKIATKATDGRRRARSRHKGIERSATTADGSSVCAHGCAMRDPTHTPQRRRAELGSWPASVPHHTSPPRTPRADRGPTCSRSKPGRGGGVRPHLPASCAEADCRGLDAFVDELADRSAGDRDRGRGCRRRRRRLRLGGRRGWGGRGWRGRR